MDSELVGNIIEILLPVLATVLTAIFSWLGVRLKSLYEEKINTETKQKIVEYTVKYVEQVYTELHGQEKLKKAIETASEWIKGKGLPISEVELTILIEAAVKSLNLEEIFIETEEVKTLNESCNCKKGV